MRWYTAQQVKCTLRNGRRVARFGVVAGRHAADVELIIARIGRHGPKVLMFRSP